MFLIETVTSHGPVGPKQWIELLMVVLLGMFMSPLFLIELSFEKHC
ncbi:TPA: hypothetical protein ACX6Q6_003022 [Photobacterium damselae]